LVVAVLNEWVEEPGGWGSVKMTQPKS
jgi:hypothetical protein